MGTEGHVARRFARRHSNLRLEPLPMGVNQTHQRDGSATDHGGKTGQIIEGVFGRRVEDVVSTQRVEARRFIRR